MILLCTHTSARWLDYPIYNTIPGRAGIPGNEEADRQANLARDASGDTVIERPYTAASNIARRISEGRSASRAKWEADKCSKHFSYRLKVKTGTKRPVPMTSVKSLATRFYRLKCGHAPTGLNLKRLGHREVDKCWWCGGRGRTAQTCEHLFRHCSRWRDQQQALWKAVGKATGWKAGRCRHVQISELFFVEECDQAVMDFLAATEVGEFPPRWRSGMEQAQRLTQGRGRIPSLLFFSFLFGRGLVYHLVFSSVSGDEG